MNHAKFPGISHIFLLAAFAAFAGLAGCAKTENPAVVADVDAGPGGPTVAEPGAPIVRTVVQRSPFGNLSIPDNLVLDGDFEFTGRSGQMPWLVFGNSGQGTLAFATGGACRSGIRCAAVPAGSEMIGWMASPKSGGMNVSLWVKPPSGKCDDLRVSITDMAGSIGGDIVRSETLRAGTDGWCRFNGDAGNYAGQQPVVYIATANNRVQGPILVDDVVARTLPSTLKKNLAAAPSPGSRPSPLDTETLARVRFIGEWLRAHRIFGMPERSPIEAPDSRLIDAPRQTIR